MVMNGALYERLVAPGGERECVVMHRSAAHIAQQPDTAQTSRNEQLDSTHFSLTKQQLRQRVRSLAAALEGEGLRLGEQVALGELADGLAVLVAVLAVTSCGACVVLGDWCEHVKDLQLAMLLTSKPSEESDTIKALQLNSSTAGSCTTVVLVSPGEEEYKCRCLSRVGGTAAAASGSLRDAGGASNKMSTVVQHDHDQIAVTLYTGVKSSLAQCTLDNSK